MYLPQAGELRHAPTIAKRGTLWRARNTNPAQRYLEEHLRQGTGNVFFTGKSVNRACRTQTTAESELI
jgi:hypothetical protein